MFFSCIQHCLCSSCCMVPGWLILGVLCNYIFSCGDISHKGYFYPLFVNVIRLPVFALYQINQWISLKESIYHNYVLITYFSASCKWWHLKQMQQQHSVTLMHFIVYGMNWWLISQYQIMLMDTLEEKFKSESFFCQLWKFYPYDK